MIRQAGVADAALLADLSRETFYETFASQNEASDMQLFMDQQFTREALMREPGQPGNIFYLAYYDAEPAGYVRLRDRSPDGDPETLPAMEIARIYVLKKWIGYGIGKALMETSIETARTQGKKMLWLGVWEKNGTAIGFFRRWGFEKFGQHDFLLGKDLQVDWLMKKLL